MNGTLYFEIPDDPEIMVRLVEAIPPNWEGVSLCRLNAPQRLVDSGVVQKDTGFSLSSQCESPTIVGDDFHCVSKRCPNLHAIMVEQKLPGFIKIFVAGYDGKNLPITCGSVNQIIIAFLQKGYRGNINFISGYYVQYHRHPATCQFALEPWNGEPHMREEMGPQPARVKLEWNSEYGGSERMIAPIVEVCREIKLREYTPTPTKAAAH